MNELLLAKIAKATAKMSADEIYLFEADLEDAIDGVIEDYA
jgi:hypothetical protein